ncbi:bifunctional riboflavin kinase/FAD synthetase [Rhodoligotrophos defluvii]|uniref:bifunctional riboflavin kinase/FAD synthetase n=1 Tax=Rhodoligotrophos defluvii TaxID=2561934 RepID=UPI0010C9AD81|nr:bifunctional riboflavin kinase/FAD synthetase [Rhodoligotrophos defluvii]
MVTLHGNTPVPVSCRGAVVAIGNYDGVHRGHQALLATAREEAQRCGAPFGVLTFEPHPRTFFRPEQPVFRITPAELKTKLLHGCGADFVSILSFDRTLASQEAEAFVRDVLVRRHGAVHVVTGYDFHFGKGRKGSPDLMRRLGEELGFGVTVVEQVTDDSGVAPFASSAIRHELRHGDVAVAAEQLGYRWTVLAKVVPGDQRGRSLGFPTINIKLEEGCEPGEGIYAVRVRRGQTVWRGAGYIGKRPTFGKNDVALEVYLLDFSGDLYGEQVAIEFIDYIRPDRAFSDAASLTAQMERDVAEIDAVLARIEANDSVARFPLGRLQVEGRL